MVCSAGRDGGHSGSLPPPAPAAVAAGATAARTAQGQPQPLRAGVDPFDSHDDHRLVMAAAVLGLAVPGLRVSNAATVGKTFPAFTALWQQMLAGRH